MFIQMLACEYKMLGGYTRQALPELYQGEGGSTEGG